MRSRLFVLLLLAGCQAPPPPPAEPPARVVTALAPADARTLRMRVSAPRGRALRLDNCNGAFSWGLERPEGGVWKRAWTVATDACHSAPVEIAPGESRTFTEAITLSGEERIAAGTYRITIYALHGAPERSSQPFTLGALPSR